MNLAVDALNHLLLQNSWAVDRLQPYAGKVVRIILTPMETTLLIDGAGEFSPAPPDAPIDTTLGCSPAAALRLWLSPSAPPDLISLQGDPALGALLSEILRNLNWDAEEDLSRIVGDIPARQLSQAGSHITAELRRQAWSVAGMFAEYWLEEQPLIAKKPQLDAFGQEVRQLKLDTDSLAQRIERMEKLS